MGNASPVPETYSAPDWHRRAAKRINGHEGRLSSLEANGAGTFVIDDGTAAATGVFSFNDRGA